MAMIRKNANGDFYVHHGNSRDMTAFNKKPRDWFRGSVVGNSVNAKVHMASISLPKELFGKRFRLKVEVIE